MTKVYKYRTADPAFLQRDIDSLCNNQFFAPRFDMLNDPLEANFHDNISAQLRELMRISGVNTQKITGQLHRILAAKLEVGLYALSKTCLSETMWAYYAGTYTGYCIEYDLERLADKSLNSDLMGSFEISYSDQPPLLQIQDIASNSLLQKMFAVKKKTWQPEQEIRLLFDQSSLKNYHPSSVTSIIFGYRTNQNLKELVYAVMKDRDMLFYEIQASGSNHRLEKKLVNQFHRPLKFSLDKFRYEILKYRDRSVIENFHVRLFDEQTTDSLSYFVAAFREKHCIKQNTIYIYNTSDIINLIDVYPLGETDYIKYADALMTLADTGTGNDLTLFPFKDSYYRKLSS